MLSHNLLLTGDDGYNLTKSLRFRSSAGASLSRTPSVAGNQQTWTWSGWFKRGILSSTQPAIFSCGTYPTNLFQVIFDNGSTADIINITNYPNSTTPNLDLRTTQVFRDPSSWYHIIIATDTTQATNANRVKLYINGVQVTAFGTATYPAQNASLNINNNGITNNIGNRPTNSNPFDGYMTEINFIDGQALTPSSFGSTNALTGVWQPAKYTGTYGTNGFYLPFTNTTSTSTLGNDFSGNSNTWTVNNISLTTGSTYDSMTDVPTLTSATTANYCVLNRLDPNISNLSVTLSNGNLTASGSTYGATVYTASMQLPSSGKWYYEFSYSTLSTTAVVGIRSYTTSSTDVRYRSDGQKDVAGTVTSYGATWTTGDVLGVAVDRDAGTVTFYKNNTSQGAISIPTNSAVFDMAWNSTTYASTTFSANFGQQGFTYTPPTGFVALNTYNLPTSTIVKGNTVMDATLYTGNGTSQSITNAAGYKPDLVWTKSRSNANNHGLIDSVRGVSKWIGSNSNAAQDYTAGSYVTAFNSNGFSVGTGGVSNENGQTYVGWQWQAGQGTTSSNTQGSVTSTVSVNPSAGFSVFTFNSGSAGTQTVGHGLGVYPGMVVFKDLAGGYWNLWHSAFSNPAQGYMYLDLTNGVANDASQWSNTAPTSSVFTYNSNYSWTANRNMVAYAWAPIAGYSAFGSYTGNGSTDGTFVYTGFRPRFVMVKCSSDVTSWWIYDSSRNTYNAVDLGLLPNLSNADTSGYSLDFLSNGFKFRNSNGDFNGSGRTYIYMAFAENPFRNSLAR